MPKKEKSSLANVISNAATTFTQALKPEVSISAANNSMIVHQTTPKILSPGIGISPVEAHTILSASMSPASLSCSYIFTTGLLRGYPLFEKYWVQCACAILPYHCGAS